LLQSLPVAGPHCRAAQVADEWYRRHVVLDQQVQTLEAVCRCKEGRRYSRRVRYSAVQSIAERASTAGGLLRNEL
jgi:hypothetical protein